MSGLIVAPIIAFFGGLLISWFVLAGTVRIQDVARRFDQLCEDIRNTADMGVDYWVSSAKDSGRAAEAKIIGRQELINSSLLSLGNHLDSNKVRDWAKCQDKFFVELTGGGFMNRDREPEPERARMVQIEMGRLISNIRQFQTSTMKWRRILAIALMHK